LCEKNGSTSCHRKGVLLPCGSSNRSPHRGVASQARGGGEGKKKGPSRLKKKNPKYKKKWVEGTSPVKKKKAAGTRKGDDPASGLTNDKRATTGRAGPKMKHN